MDMRVEKINMGASVNGVIRSDLVKDLRCGLTTQKGERVSVNVWNGLVDCYKDEIPELRDKVMNLKEWLKAKQAQNMNLYLKDRFAKHPEEIVGQILEVRYFEKTQNQANKKKGVNEWSLQQPVIVRVRSDKATTSEF